MDIHEAFEAYVLDIKQNGYNQAPSGWRDYASCRGGETYSHHVFTSIMGRQTVCYLYMPYMDTYKDTMFWAETPCKSDSMYLTGDMLKEVLSLGLLPKEYVDSIGDWCPIETEDENV
jgi:hypothetical protein